MQLLILKTGALGDVLRTTSILPGWMERHPGTEVTWLTAPAARELVCHHPLVAHCVTDAAVLESGGPWDRILSLDDEEPLCALASRLTERSTGRPAGADGAGGVLSGAFLDADGARRYTDDVAPWFDMGLLSRFGKEEADRRKVANTRSHPAIYADMFGVRSGEPELPLPEEATAFAARFAERASLHAHGPVIGMNTGSGGRWESKKLPVERTVALMETLAAARDGELTFLLLGGPEEAERNAAIRAAASDRVRLVDAGTDNALLDFAALVDRLDLLVTSDSLALHVANARQVPLVAFFAPTSAAEVDLYGRGIAVASTAPDACSYRKDADTSTLTVERLSEAVLEVLRTSLRRGA